MQACSGVHKKAFGFQCRVHTTIVSAKVSLSGSSMPDLFIWPRRLVVFGKLSTEAIVSVLDRALKSDPELTGFDISPPARQLFLEYLMNLMLLNCKSNVQK